MNLQEFLTRIVPDGTVVAGQLVPRVDAKGKPFMAFSHTVAHTHENLAARLLAIDAQQSNAYFALACYKQGFHPKPSDPAKMQVRVRTNVESLKALWFDIDFKDVYPDIPAAATALTVFCKAIGMPAPSILVGSGNGMHVYWTFTTPVPLDQWQKLADALKAVAIEQKLAVDPTCTADAARVLRPIETHNWKDPSNPKPVRVLFASPKDYTYEELEAVLMPWTATKKISSVFAAAVGKGLNDEIAGGLTKNETPATFEQITKHCAVARMIVETHGKDSPEPLWMNTLQLLKHCTDGPMWVHAVSDGHPGYDITATDTKWQHRLQNDKGPTLCSTFEGYEPSICGKCPHRGFVKTPLQLGHEDSNPIEGMPAGWRIAPERKGIERLMIDPTTNQKEWVKVLRHVPANLKATRSIVTQRYDLMFDVEFGGSQSWVINLPGAALGNSRKLCETVADYGFVLKEREAKAFNDLMSSWLGQLQAARRVADVTEQLGWLVEKTPDGEKLVGFSYGPSTFYADGRVRNDVKASRDFASIARFYEPKGGLDEWKKVAGFLAEQDLSAFTATLAAAFGTPLLRFTGLSGGILSLVSTASGVGKSSALKCSQAVWGSPPHAINAVDDTPKSVARKLGFLNNLPAYWDELRGRKAVDDFLTLAFQITQGKEKTRLDSSAQLKDVSTWETMVVVASNESVFEAMARHSGGSDAGVVRTFEIVVDKVDSTRNRAELSMMFEKLNSNYGHAGKVYAQYLATHAKEVEARVQEVFKRVATVGNMQAQERFWFAIATILIVGAELAGKLDLVKINVRSLTGFLMQNIDRLRGRSVDAMSMAEPSEILAAFMSSYQDRMLIVDAFPKAKSNTKGYLPDITGGIPRSDKIVYHIARDTNTMRVPRQELERWLEYRELPVYNIIRRLRVEFGVIETESKLGIGTRWELPKQKLFEIQLSKFGLDAENIPSMPTAAPEDAPGMQADIPSDSVA